MVLSHLIYMRRKVLTKRGQQEKELRKLQSRLDYLKYNFNHGYHQVELEVPYKHGFWVFLVLRDDIARSNLGKELKKILEIHSKDIWAKDKTLKSRRAFDYYHNRYYIKSPFIKKISYKYYRQLPAKIQKYFVEDRTSWSSYLNTYQKYKPIFPKYFFKEKYVTAWVTTKSIPIPEILSEINYLNSRIWENEVFRKLTLKTWNSSKWEDERYKFINKFDKMMIKEALISNEN